MSLTKIIVCDEKHNNSYYDASTPEAWAKSALAILTERWNDGYWYQDPDEDGLGTSEWAEKRRAEYARALSLTDEQIAELPAEAQKAVNKLRSDAKRDSEHDKEHRAWYELAKQVVEDQDLGTFLFGDRKTARTKAGKEGRYERREPKAWVLLYQRSDHEYEGVSLEDLQS